MAAFGWSVGDLVAAASFIAKITKALKDTGGASSQYQQTIQDLEALEITLRYLQDIKPNDANFALVNAICARSQASQCALRDLIDGFKKFDESLGHAAPEGWFKGAHRKAQWALFASKELKQLHAIIGPQLQSLGLLLQTQQWNAITSSSEALATKATEQVNLMKELKDDIGGLQKRGDASKVKEMEVTQSIMDGSREAQVMLHKLKSTTEGICSTIATDRKVLVQGRQNADRQALHIMNSLQDVKQDVRYATDMLGNLVQESRLAQHRHDSTGPGRRAAQCYSSLEKPPQTALAEAAEHLIQLLYLIAIGLRELFETMLLLYPRLVFFFRVCYVLIPRSPTRLIEDNIQIRDALGRTTSLEYTIFKSWNVFNAFLRDQFKDCPGEYHVIRRKFHLFNAQRRKDLISDEEWGTKVSPGTTVLMSVGLEQLRGTSVTCPRPSCKGVTVSCKEKVSMQCLSCLLVFHPQTARYELQPCSTPLCTGMMKVFEATASAICCVCSVQSFSDSSMDNISKNNFLDRPPPGPRLVEITDEGEKPFVETSDFEPQMSLELAVQDPSTPSNLFLPILMDQTDTASSTYSDIKPQTLESQILRLQRMKLVNRRTHLESLYKEQLERENLRQRQREENDIKSLKMIHLLEDEAGETIPPGGCQELSPAKKLFIARVRLFETTKRQQMPQKRPLAFVDSEPFTRVEKDCGTWKIVYNVPLPTTDDLAVVTVDQVAAAPGYTADHITPSLDIPAGSDVSDPLGKKIQVSESESTFQEPLDPRLTDGPWAGGDLPIPVRMGMVISIEQNGDLLPNDKGHSNHRMERTFVVIRTTKDYNICLKISIYNGLGTTNPHVDTSKHALIYAARRRPYVLPEESKMKPAIAVTMLDPLSIFDPMSRVSFAKVYNISCRAQWNALGRIQGESLKSLERSFSQCFRLNFDLSHAASEGREKSVVRLLADGADPNAIVGIRGNALHGAVLGGHYRIAEILLAKGAAPYLGFAETIVDSPPLHAAVLRRATELVKAIIRRSICSSCYQEREQKALAETAARALLNCADPLEHLRKFSMPPAFGDHYGYHPRSIMEASLPFCPQLWPLLVFMRAHEISTFRSHR